MHQVHRCHTSLRVWNAAKGHLLSLHFSSLVVHILRVILRPRMSFDRKINRDTALVSEVADEVGISFVRESCFGHPWLGPRSSFAEPVSCLIHVAVRRPNNTSRTRLTQKRHPFKTNLDKSSLEHASRAPQELLFHTKSQPYGGADQALFWGLPHTA